MKVLAALLLTTGLLLTAGHPAAAQAQPAPAATPSSSQQLLKPEELDALLAPVALYPDALLASVIMASTYPLEVVQADRWAQSNKNLKGDDLAKAATAQGWDNSVVSLVSTPSVLTMMSTKLDWTQKLGDAVLAQQTDVMDAVQRLRAKADANNKLTTTKEQKVTKTTQGSRQVITIEPAQPNTVYVPYYDPGVVYGDWAYPAYPPYAFPYAGWVPGAAIATGLAFGAGVAMGAWAWNKWGGGFNWGNNNINVNRNTNINNIGNNNNWSHNVDHRHGVRYNNSNVAQKFGGNAANRGQVQNRMDFRGRDGKPALDPGNRGDRAGDRAGDRGGRDRPSTADRGGARDRAGDRAGDRGGSRDRAGNRGGDRGGNRANAGGRERATTGARGGGRDSAFSGAGGSGRNARAQADRGRASLAGRGGGGAQFAGGRGGGGGFHGGGGGGGFRGGGGGGGFRGGGGGGRRSDIRLKHDVVLLGHLDNGLGFYRFAYGGSERAYVGVIAQEVQTIRPDAVVRGQDGYLRVLYGKLGVTFESYEHWVAAGGRIPSPVTSGSR